MGLTILFCMEMNDKTAVITPRDLEQARELGILSGEVRTLKWGVGIVAVIIFSFLIVLYQEIGNVQDKIDVVQNGLNDVQNDLNNVQNDLNVLKEIQSTIQLSRCA